MVAPVPNTAVSVPSGKAPTRPLIEIGVDVSIAASATVIVTTATVPLAIVVAFMPAATQVTDAAAVAHVTDLPAAMRAGPAATVTEAISTDGYESVHCRAAGAVAPVILRFTEMDPPDAAEPEFRLRAVWATPYRADTRISREGRMCSRNRCFGRINRLGSTSKPSSTRTKAQRCKWLLQVCSK
jgi:hypothetical protein